MGEQYAPVAAKTGQDISTRSLSIGTQVGLASARRGLLVSLLTHSSPADSKATVGSAIGGAAEVSLSILEAFLHAH
jgi:hypothetical protein